MALVLCEANVWVAFHPAVSVMVTVKLEEQYEVQITGHLPVPALHTQLIMTT
jgi:hypothetical protein